MKEVDIYNEIITNAGDDLVEYSFVERHRQLYFQEQIESMNIIQSFRDAFSNTLAHQIDEMMIDTCTNPKSIEALNRILGVKI